MLAKQPESENTCYRNVTDCRVGGHEGRRRKNGSLSRRELPRTFIARFHTKYQTSDGCWLWQAGKYAKGYGMVAVGRDIDGKLHVEYAHRAAYVIFKGDIPEGLVVMHSCDTPACVNPEHLSLGTQGDNVRDAAQKGHYNVPRPRIQKLSSAQVADIRRSREKGVRLAERYGVTPAHISLLRAGKRRKAA